MTAAVSIPCTLEATFRLKCNIDAAFMDNKVGAAFMDNKVGMYVH